MQQGTNILEQWKNLSFEFPPILVSNVSDASDKKVFSFESFFKDKLANGHGRHNGEEKFPDLFSFLEADPKTRKTISEEFATNI